MKLTKSQMRVWELVHFDNGIEAALSKDGSIYAFERVDIEPFLMGLPRDAHGWYFNTTRDRYCAEIEADGFVTVNPSKVEELLGHSIEFKEANPWFFTEVYRGDRNFGAK